LRFIFFLRLPVDTDRVFQYISRGAGFGMSDFEAASPYKIFRVG
jgi:hypothetical protein